MKSWATFRLTFKPLNFITVLVVLHLLQPSLKCSWKQHSRTMFCNTSCISITWRTCLQHRLLGLTPRLIQQVWEETLEFASAANSQVMQCSNPREEVLRRHRHIAKERESPEICSSKEHHLCCCVAKAESSSLIQEGSVVGINTGRQHLNTVAAWIISLHRWILKTEQKYEEMESEIMEVNMMIFQPVSSLDSHLHLGFISNSCLKLPTAFCNWHWNQIDLCLNPALLAVCVPVLVSFLFSQQIHKMK